METQKQTSPSPNRSATKPLRRRISDGLLLVTVGRFPFITALELSAKIERNVVSIRSRLNRFLDAGIVNQTTGIDERKDFVDEDGNLVPIRERRLLARIAGQFDNPSYFWHLTPKGKDLVSQFTDAPLCSWDRRQRMFVDHDREITMVNLRLAQAFGDFPAAQSDHDARLEAEDAEGSKHVWHPDLTFLLKDLTFHLEVARANPGADGLRKKLEDYNLICKSDPARKALFVFPTKDRAVNFVQNAHGWGYKYNWVRATYRQKLMDDPAGSVWITPHDDRTHSLFD